ncbi:hypothetical protein [Streptomyces sp. NPDC101165]
MTRGCPASRTTYRRIFDVSVLGTPGISAEAGPALRAAGGPTVR